jgi:hypothetical protein
MAVSAETDRWDSVPPVKVVSRSMDTAYLVFNGWANYSANAADSCKSQWMVA